MRKLVFAFAAIATLAFAAPVYASPNCNDCVVAEGSAGCGGCVVAEGSAGCGGCVVADCGGAACVVVDSGGCSTCIIADGSGNGGNVTGFAAGPSCTAEDNKGHCIESASYQCAPYSEACRLPRKPRRGKIADGGCNNC
jgi:hypothetical protein